jgi:hypothetical protein
MEGLIVGYGTIGLIVAVLIAVFILRLAGILSRPNRGS